MAIGDDTTINFTDKVIEVKRKRYTVNQLYSHLMNQFDESTQMDDLIPIEAKTPTLYEMKNGWVMSTLSWDFLYNSAVTETKGGTTNWNIWTNVRSLGAIEPETRLHVQQGTVVTFEAYYPFCVQTSINPGVGTIVVSATVPPSVATIGDLIVGQWLGTAETLSFSSWANGSSLGTFVLTAGTVTANTHNVDEVLRAPHFGHFDICHQTKIDNADIDGQTFKTYCRKFQKAYSDFTTTGGPIVSNVPVSSAADPFLDISSSTIIPWENTVTIEWQTSNVKRSAFDGTTNVQEYVLQTEMNSSTLVAVTSTTIAAAVPSSGHLQIESEVMGYSSWANGVYGTFTLVSRGTFDTAAASHLAAKDLSTNMFEYNVLIQTTYGLSLKQIYNFVQYELLQKYDIADDASERPGWITNPLVEYTGMLWTKNGIWTEGFASADKSNIRYRDVNAIIHYPPIYILLKLDASEDMGNGRGALYRLNAAYNPAAYTIVTTLIDSTLNASGDATTTIKYDTDWYVLARARKAGYLPFETGAQITSAGLVVLCMNPVDAIYTP